MEMGVYRHQWSMTTRLINVCIISTENQRSATNDVTNHVQELPVVNTDVGLTVSGIVGYTHQSARSVNDDEFIRMRHMQ